MLWLIAANPNKYDIDAAFDELQFIDWTKNANYKKNDIIFIYVSNPVQRIKYICKVINDNVNEDEAIDDKKYWLNSSDFNKSSNSHVRLELIKKIKFGISFDDLRTHGFNGNLQGPRKLFDSTNNLYNWASYIINKTNMYEIKKNTQNSEDTVLTVPINGTEDLIKKYKIHAHPLKSRYPNKMVNYIAFRKPGGIINAIYEIVDIKDTVPSQYKNNDNVLKYIKERYPNFGFSNDNTLYRFYILKDYVKLDVPYVLSPNPQSAKYMELEDLINDQTKYELFWKKFESKAFNNKEYASLFQKSKTLNRANYLVSLNNNDKGFVIRKNSQNNCIEFYIRRSSTIFEFYKNHILELEHNIPEHFEISKSSLDSSTIHKKFILNYPYNNIENNEFINWAINRCITIKKNIEMIDKQLEKTELINSYEDDKLQIKIAKIKKAKNHFEYTDEIIPLPEFKEINGIKVYKRDKQRAINALNHANYSCEIDIKHMCFLRKDGITPYTEAHHLIPLAFQYKFKNSLDIEENIVSLCSNCHNEIHYGFNAKKLISKLFEERKDILKAKGINITIDELYEYYGL